MHPPEYSWAQEGWGKQDSHHLPIQVWTADMLKTHFAGQSPHQCPFSLYLHFCVSIPIGQCCSHPSAFHCFAFGRIQVKFAELPGEGTNKGEPWRRHNLTAGSKQAFRSTNAVITAITTVKEGKEAIYRNPDWNFTCIVSTETGKSGQDPRLVFPAVSSNICASQVDKDEPIKF